MWAKLGFDFSEGFDIRFIVVLIVFAATLVSLVVFGLAYFRSDRLETRLRAVRDRRKELIHQQRIGLQQKSRVSAAPETGLKGWALGKFSLQNILDAKALRAKLARAGRRQPSAVTNYLFSRLAYPVVLGFAAFVFAVFLADKQSLGVRALIVIGAIGVGVMLPQILLSSATQKRQKILQRAFPDALDLIVICIEAGMSVEAAFNKVTEQMLEGAPLMAEEMGLTAAELAFISERRVVYENLQARTGLPGFKSLASTLLQSEKYGTPVASGLRVLAQENREIRMAAAEKKAASLPAKLTVPMIVFFLPVLFLVIAGPAGIQVASNLK